MKNFKKLMKKITVSMVIFSLTLWSFGFEFLTFGMNVKLAKAANGVINVEYMDDGGPSSETFLDTLGKTEAILKISMFDDAGGTLNSVAVCLDETAMAGNNFNAINDLEHLSLWKDMNGDAMLGSSTDDLLATSSNWSVTSSAYMNNNSCWKINFGGLAMSIPTTYANKLVLFVAATPKDHLDMDPLYEFIPSILHNGIDITSGGVITDTPQNDLITFRQVLLGQEDGTMGAPLVISEVQTGGTGSTSDEFIEIYNRENMDMPTDPMGSWFVAYAPYSTANNIMASSSWTLVPLDPGGIIPGGGYYLVAHLDYGGETDQTNSASTTYESFDMDASGGYVGIFSPMGELVDYVGYGTLASSSLAEGGMPSSAPSADGSIERKSYQDSDYSMMTTGVDRFSGNAYDSNINQNDFIVRSTSEPQNSNAPLEYSDAGYIDGGDGSPILINEFFYKTDPGLGWIELYNRDNQNTVNVSEWKLKSRMQTYTFPAGSNIFPGSHLVVRWNKSGMDITEEKFTSNSDITTVSIDIGTFGGDILLTDAGDTPMDYVQFGGSGWYNEAIAVSSGEWMEDNFVPNCLYNQSIGRQSTNGEDYNNSGDWQMFLMATPGYENAGGDSTAPSGVTNVVLVDPDNSPNSGLNGNDILISWNPALLPDPSFDRYEIYLLPEGTAINYNTHKPIDFMSGGQYLNGSSIYIYNGAPFITEDSAKVALSNGDYIAYVLVFDTAGNKSVTAQSVPATLTSEVYNVVNDYNPPFINHSGAWQSEAGSDLDIYARFKDDLELNAITPAKIIWKAGTDTTYPDLTGGTTAESCSLLASDFYNCSIAWDSGWNTNTVIGYYLQAKDANNNLSYFSAAGDPGASEATAQANHFYVEIRGEISDLGVEADLSGYTYKSDGSPLAGVNLVLEGTAIRATTTNANGYFEFPDNTLDSGSYGLMAFREGYMDRYESVFRGNSLNIYMNEGNMDNMGGSDMPMVTWTAPGPGMMGAPTDIYCSGDCSSIGEGETPIIIGFNRPMSPSTINDSDAANSGSNIFLTSNGQDRIAGKVYYDESMNEARFYAATLNSLSPNTFYNIIVTQGVTDTDGMPIEGGMTEDGSFSSGFTTMMDTNNVDFNDYGDGGMMMPPYVMGTTPFGGAVNVNIGTSIVIEFSEPMQSSSINSNTIKLFPVTNTATWAMGAAVTATVNLDQATGRIATLNPSSDLSTSYNWYVIKVMGQAKSTLGIYMSDPSTSSCVDISICSELANVVAYESSFQIDTVSGTDNTAPTIKGTYPQNGSTNINVGIPGIEIGFSEPMDPATITSSNITLKAGTRAVSGNVRYDPMANRAKFSPLSSLSASTQYILTINNNVKDLSSNRIATSTAGFTTGLADTISPSVIFANGDDYSIALTFSEPVNSSSQTDTANWAYSALNPANYSINGMTYDGGCANPGSWICPVTLDAPYNVATGTPFSSINGLAFTYDESSMTVIIDGFAFDSGSSDFQIFVDNVRDKSNNVLADSGNRASDSSHLNAARGPILNSSDTYGDIGIGGGDYITDMGEMGMMMAGAFPMNMMAGQASMYFVDIPTTKSIPVGGKIVLTFPSGFDVSSAVADPNSPVNNDINEWSAGKVTINSVTGNQIARTITIVATTSATQINDYLHMDIKGIINSSIPKEFGTDGYTVDIKTFTGDGAMLESIQSMPFFIGQGGNLTISGNINGIDGGDSGSMTVFLGSPMTGPMEREVVITGGAGSYSFTNLQDGEYHIFTDPFITVGSNNYTGSQMPEPIWMNGGNQAKNINLSSESSGGAAVTVTLTGDFTTDGVADNIDVFAGSPNGFRVKTLTNLGNVNGVTTTIYLPSGDWMVGVGPAMPKGPMSGPPPMPDWMPPMSTKYISDGVSAGNVNISIAGQVAYTISGTVVDGGGTGISNAEVFAYQPMGSFGGAHTKSAADGTFVLKIPVIGTYKIGAFKPGLPEPREKVLDITENATGLTFKITKPANTISGKVLNSDGQAVAYAPVWSYNQNGWGHADAMTNSTGNYILYVDNGSWKIEGDVPGLGWMQYDNGRAITINGNSVADINLSPNSTTNFYTISGMVGVDTNGIYSNVENPFTGMPIRAVEYDANGVYLGREFNGVTDSSGNYAISVPVGIYRVDIWTPEYGEIGVNNQDQDNTLNEAVDDDKYANNPAMINATGGDVANADILIVNSDLNTITLNITNSQANQEGFLNIEGVNFIGDEPVPNGFYFNKHLSDLSVVNTVKLIDGDYLIFLHVPGIGEVIPILGDNSANNGGGMHPAKGDIVVSGDRTVNFTILDITDASAAVTVSGIITVGSDPVDPVDNAWVWVGHPTNGYHQGIQTASNGTYSIIIPVANGYKMGVDKPGFMSLKPINLDASMDTIKDFTLLANPVTTISGYLKDGSSNNIPNGMVRIESDDGTKKQYAPADGDGYYEVGAANGEWTIYGMADGFTETSATVIVSGNTTKNITLSVDNNWGNKSKKKQITPASGGVIDDIIASGTKMKLVIPPNALGSSNSAGNVNTKTTSVVTKTNSSEPVGSKGTIITASDNSGQPITNLNDYVDMEMVLYKADVDAGLADESLTYDKLKNTKISYWDETLNDWSTLSTNRKAYYASGTEWVLYTDVNATSSFEAFIDTIATAGYSDYRLNYSAKTKHFTVFAIIMPFVIVSTPDPEPDPVVPSSGGGGTRWCSTVTYTEWESACVNSFQTRGVDTKSPSSCTLTTSQQLDLTKSCDVEDDVEVVELIDDEKDVPESFVSIVVDEIYLDQGAFVGRGDVNEIMEMMGIHARNHEGEIAARGILRHRLGIVLEELVPSAQYALTNFITYGSPDTYKLGSGERAGVVNSFRSAFGHLPYTDTDWQDVIKIANGRWPGVRKTAAEDVATEHFRKIYLRIPDLSNPHDDAAVVVIAYGLRPVDRNTESEVSAINTFRHIYGYQPTSAIDWDVVRAIAYSGAIR